MVLLIIIIIIIVIVINHSDVKCDVPTMELFCRVFEWKGD
jgi:uncharacterized integral membrane protein